MVYAIILTHTFWKRIPSTKRGQSNSGDFASEQSHETLRIHVLNILVLDSFALVIVVQVRGRYVIVGYLGP